MITPAKMKLAVNEVGPGDYTAVNFPKAVRLDGNPSDLPDVDGLPAVLKVALLNTEGSVLLNANCKGCMSVRLVKCDSSTPTSGTTDGSNAATAIPACGGHHNTTIVQSGDQMDGLSQALCVADYGQCTLANHGHHQTLSNSPNVINGTIADVNSGIAKFHNLQPHYTFGAGFRLLFTFDFELNYSTRHTAIHANIFLPDVGLHISAETSSFIIRPYALEVLQHPGGDGVDIDTSTQLVGDGRKGTSDGSGRGFPFVVQPAVAVTGFNRESRTEYYFTLDRANHGHAPLTAVIKSSTCTSTGMVLYGNTTGVTSRHTRAHAVLQEGTDIFATFGGASGMQAVELKYIAKIGMVGFIWHDLVVTTKDDQTGAEGLRLQVLTGYNTSSLAAANKAYTVADTGLFDIFIEPDGPLNVHILGYSEEGYRLEFNAAQIFRTKPLSGFIIEIDLCTQSKPGDSSTSCALQQRTSYDASLGVAPSALGSDYYAGGGRIEEVHLSYGSNDSAMPTAVTIRMQPSEFINDGENITLNLNFPGVLMSKGNGSCTPEGPFGAHVAAALDPNTSTVVLAVKSGYFLPAGQPVAIILPASCGFVYPAKDAQLSNSIHVSRYGGTSFPRPPEYAIAYITGAVTGDNCKGSGCQASSTSVLPAIQDAVSLCI